MPAPTPSDTGAYVPDPSAAGTDTSAPAGIDPAADPTVGADSAGVDSGMGTDTLGVPADTSAAAPQ